MLAAYAPLLSVATCLTLAILGAFVWIGRVAERVNDIDDVKRDVKELGAKVDDLLFAMIGTEYMHVRQRRLQNGHRQDPI